jgi:hypothetical protein
VKAALAPYRLGAQRLVGEPLGSPADVVGHLGAVQSQLHDMALWAISLRCGATLADVEAAFERGDFVRTHILRPTWHHVLPSDLTDLLEVTAPRIRQAMTSGNKLIGLTPERIEKAADIACSTIEVADGPLTRAEVDEVLTDAGFPRVDNSLAHVMIHAELTGRIASGPMRGRQHTYRAIDLPSSTRSPDERLAWIALLYGRGHGPFRARDLAWWTTLTLTQARRAVELAGLSPLELAGETYYVGADVKPGEVPRALLLPNFDEFISYARDPDDFAGIGGRDWSMLMRAGGLLFIDGQLAGSWARKLGAKNGTVDVFPAGPVSRPVRSAIEAEAARFEEFAERPIALQIQ